jgi:ankyrin repeat protein
VGSGAGFAVFLKTRGGCKRSEGFGDERGLGNWEERTLKLSDPDRVELNKRDGRSGRSPMPVANANGLASTVAKLLDLGADPLRKDQQGRTAFDLAANKEAKTAFAEPCEQVDITDEIKDELMLLCARLRMVSRLPAVLQAWCRSQTHRRCGQDER